MSSVTIKFQQRSSTVSFKWPEIVLVLNSKSNKMMGQVRQKQSINHLCCVLWTLVPAGQRVPELYRSASFSSRREQWSSGKTQGWTVRACCHGAGAFTSPCICIFDLPVHFHAIFLPHKNENPLVIFWRPYLNVFASTCKILTASGEENPTLIFCLHLQTGKPLLWHSNDENIHCAHTHIY